MTFAVFAKTHYPLKHSSSPRPRVFDISKDLKPGDIVYYIIAGKKYFGKFLRYDSRYSQGLEIWAIWQRDWGNMLPSEGYCPPSFVHLHTGETPADLLNV